MIFKITIMKDYNDLDIMEKKEYDATLLHCVHSFSTAFCMGNEIIELSKKYKILDNTKISREQYKPIANDK